MKGKSRLWQNVVFAYTHTHAWPLNAKLGAGLLHHAVLRDDPIPVPAESQQQRCQTFAPKFRYTYPKLGPKP